MKPTPPRPSAEKRLQVARDQLVVEDLPRLPDAVGAVGAMALYRDKIDNNQSAA
jgi:hypothetical protein